MPAFKFTSPNGKMYTVNGPDGATPDQAFQILQSQMAASAPVPEQASTMDRVNAAAAGANKGFYTQIPGLPVDTAANVLDLAKAGVGYVTSKVTGGQPPEWTAPYDRTKIFGSSDYIADKIRKFGGTKIIDNQTPNDRIANVMYGAGNAAGASALAPASSIKQMANNMVVGGVGGATGTISANAAKDAGYGQTAQTIAGLAGGIAGTSGAAMVSPYVGAGISAAANAVTPSMPKINPNIKALAQKAQEYDIPLRPDMLYDNKIVRMLGEASEKVPLSGSMAAPRQEAFNRAIIKQIGGDPEAAKLTPDVFDSAIRTSGQKIGDISTRTPVPLDRDFSDSIKSHIDNASKFETSDVQKVVASYADELKSHAIDGVIPGEAFRKINTKIGKQIRNTSNGDLKNALGDFQESMQDALQKNATGDDLNGLLAARKQYAIAKTIEPLVAKSANGDISPAGLMGRVTSNNSGKSMMARGNGGELGDLARIGQQFLKEPNSSGTTERGLAYGLLGGGMATHPATAAGVYGVANIYNRTGSSMAKKLTNGSD